MSPKSDNYRSSLGLKHFPNRSKVLKNADQWLEEKRAVDGAEDLWRLHNNLYDLTNFVNKHPGGRFWLQVTKGTDITEAFESHHISTKPDKIIKKYFVRKAKTASHSPFTFHDDGFYRTLKRNVRKSLMDIPKGADTASKWITDAVLIAAYTLATLATVYWSYPLAILSGIFLSSTVIASHNYYHQKDNFRMYYADIGLMQSREWRIIHILSHHLYTNSVIDMQTYFVEPILHFYPDKKSTLTKYGSWIYGPVIFWPIMFHFLFFVRLYHWVFKGYTNSFGKADFLPATLPLTMYVLGGQQLLATIAMWTFIIAVHSIWFSLIGVATTHYHPDIFLDGDTPRPESQMDWGISQLDTVSDRYEVTGSHLLVLLTFGDHALHHLFPTFDHGMLQHLYPVVQETMKQFDLDIRITTHIDMLGGYFRQLAKDKPNPNPPDLRKNKRIAG